ncbi:histidine--tRNA ligase [Candidatus Micrarchaeota archaeon]|nr:histidine--tRNA ligase [Candidatus Micrarchaeota archaeon]
MKLTPKGMRDILPEDAMLREQVFDLVKLIYRKYGFVPIETPAMEYLDTLRAKAGAETDKQIFCLDDQELGLRFDLTVPLARVAANNAFAKPFKRYAIGSVWRKEEPQKGRYREFTQADVDIVGSKSMRAEAEILTIAREVATALGFEKPRILLNNRKILDALAAKLGIEDKKEAIFRLLDKMDKVGEEAVKKEMNEVIGSDKTKKLFEIFDTKGDNKKKITVAKSLTEEGASELEQIVAACDFPIEVDLALVRGLGYYTGPVFEIKASDEIGSIAGGGRYDNLLGIYGQTESAVGIALGIERIIILLKQKIANSKKTYTKVFVAAVKPDFFKYSLDIASKIREQAVPCEVDLNERNLRKQLDYVNALGIPYLIVVGEREMKEKKVTLRDMTSGKEEVVSLDKAIATIGKSNVGKGN